MWCQAAEHSGASRCIMASAHAQDRMPADIPATFTAKWTTVLAAPLLYVMVVPLVIFDLCLEVYHHLAFPLFGMPIVRRREYIKIDRQLLPYLPVRLKVACLYCGYANGLIQYAARIAGETETYFCPIKHQKSPTFHAPPHHRTFAEYGDFAGFHARWEETFHDEYGSGTQHKKTINQ